MKSVHVVWTRAVAGTLQYPSRTLKLDRNWSLNALVELQKKEAIPMRFHFLHGVSTSLLSRFALMLIGLLVSLLLFDPAAAAFSHLKRRQPRTAKPALDLQAVESSQTPAIRDLRRDEPIKQELSGKEWHVYRITLQEGQYTQVVVEQKGLDVAIRLFGPRGQKISEVDSNLQTEPESISVLAETSGEYRLEVWPTDKKAATGVYEIRIEEWRTGTSRDKDRFAAQIASWEADQLQTEGTAESLRNAIDRHEQALRLWRAVEDLRREATTLNDIGTAYSDLGELQKALQYYHQGLPLHRSVRDVRGESINLNNIGIVYAKMGQSERALEYYRQALPLKQAIGNRKSEANTLHAIAGAYSQLGEFEKALEYYDRALPLTRMTGERFGESAILGSIGALYYRMGNWQKAAEYHRQSLVIARALGNRREEASVMYNLGLVYQQLGETQTALEYYKQALPLRRTVGDKRGEAYTLNAMGSAYASLGDDQKALDYCTQALPLMRDLADKYGEANALNSLGGVLLRSGKFENAMDYFDQALRVSRAAGDRLGEVYALRNIGSAYVKLNEFEKAKEYLTPALTISRAIGDRGREAAILGDMARVERGQHRLTEARSLIENSLTIVESTRHALSSSDLRASYMTTKRSLYEFHIDLLMQMHKESPTGGFDSLALHASERARARSLLDMLIESRADIRQGVDASLLEKERTLGQQLSVKSARLTRLLVSKHTEEQERTARKEVEVLLGDYHVVETQLRAKSPQYAALTQPQPLSIKEIQEEVLDDDTLLLEYVLGNERSYLWAVTTTSIKSFELPGRAQVEGAAQRVYELLVAKADGLYPEALLNLSKMVLKPAAEQLRKTRLIVVSEGVLQYIPFAVLPDPISGQQQSSPQSTSVPLILNHEIISLPSVTTLAVLRREASGRKAATKTLAVLADPVFEKDDERVKPTTNGQRREAQSGNDNRVHKTAFSLDLERSTGDLGLNGFGRLALSRFEAESITKLASRGQPLKALDFTASRATATSGELEQYQIVHFATHSLMNNQHPELSGIVLSLVDEQGQPQDGFLRLYEIYNLKLAADLVVLSACQTALGREIKGEGLVGLTRGFMYAGAPRVVASLWKVSDKATAELMRRFYQKMFIDGLRPAAALRAAQVSMLKERQWQAPYYWAGFVLQGEWR